MSLTQEELHMISVLSKSGKFKITPLVQLPSSTPYKKEPDFEEFTDTEDESELPGIGNNLQKGALVPNRDVGHLSGSVNEGRDHYAVQGVPKIPPFSGEDLKGDVTFGEWRYEVRCLQHDPDISQNLLMQAIRRSLKGVARRMLRSLGETATVGDILEKLDTLFGDVSTNGMIMQEFFSCYQLKDESVTNFGCRLENMLQVAIEGGYLDRAAKGELLRHKFWTSLSSTELKSQTL
ncbi:uncharacterized protein LOC117320935 [Pecten maximus]|uniref:uncharacterized protein LOC117320935 n=1 Tax=Pecten maximus TaxID=6579 RepID=UPI0014581553|nr:uncharacterized protein LOC117320935 [Pecten maximus]